MLNEDDRGRAENGVGRVFGDETTMGGAEVGHLGNSQKSQKNCYRKEQN